MRKITLLLFNARLSEKSYLGYEHVRPLLTSMLNKFTHVCCQAKPDAERMEKLGLEKQKITVTGNLKFDIAIDDDFLSDGKRFEQSYLEKVLFG